MYIDLYKSLAPRVWHQWCSLYSVMHAVMRGRKEGGDRERVCASALLKMKHLKHAMHR